MSELKISPADYIKNLPWKSKKEDGKKGKNHRKYN